MMRFPVTFLFATLIVWASAQSVTPPEMAYWLQNTEGSTARQYVQGNSTTIAQNWLVNVQQVEYSNDFVYVSSKGIPAYAIGPYLDGNPEERARSTTSFKFQGILYQTLGISRPPD